MTDAPEGPVLVVLAAGRARRYGGCKPLAPVGPSGEAVIDLVASDAYAAGFGRIVLVVGPSTGPAIRYHVERRWPAAAPVHFATQDSPLGTVHAVLSAREHLYDAPFGVGNADDLYGRDALAQLAGHLVSGDPSHALVGFTLAQAVVGSDPVTRGICRVDAAGMLVSVTERRQVVALGGGRFESRDGRQPVELPGDALVSMNLWGFGTSMLRELEDAMERAEHASEDAEVLLPEAVGSYLARTRGGGGADGPPGFRVLAATGRCVGVTHPDDLGLVQADIARQIEAGQRPATLWAALDPGGSGATPSSATSRRSSSR